MLEAYFIPDDIYLNLLEKVEQTDLSDTQKKVLRIIIGYYHQAHFLENPPKGYHPNGLLILDMQEFNDMFGGDQSMMLLRGLEKEHYLSYLTDYSTMTLRLQLNWEKF